jgi:hypothetical protein
MGIEIKNEILERHGIKISDKGDKKIVSRTCGRCNYVNKLENKYCEGKGCNYPLTQEALDEIKAAEKSKLQELVTVEIQAKDHEMHELREQMGDIMKSVQFYRNQFEVYVKEFGPRHLTEKEHKRIQEFLEQIKKTPDNDDND